MYGLFLLFQRGLLYIVSMMKKLAGDNGLRASEFAGFRGVLRMCQ